MTLRSRGIVETRKNRKSDATANNVTNSISAIRNQPIVIQKNPTTSPRKNPSRIIAAMTMGSHATVQLAKGAMKAAGVRLRRPRYAPKSPVAPKPTPRAPAWEPWCATMMKRTTATTHDQSTKAVVTLPRARFLIWTNTVLTVPTYLLSRPRHPSLPIRWQM